MRIFACTCSALMTAAALLSPSHAVAQAWPVRPVTMVVPFPAGGNADVIARAIALDLSEKLGKQFVVDNRAGAGGNIGGAAVAKAKPDGYTFLFTTPAPAALNKLMYKSMPYDPERDFDPVVLAAKSPLIIAVNAASPVREVKDLIAHAKTNPGKLNVGHPGNGTLGHITSELLQRQTGVKMTNVPYRGSAPLMTDLLGGQIDVAMDFMTTYVPLVKDGKLRPLAVTTTARAEQLPDVPTAQEAGFAGFEATAWYAVVAPRGTPGEIVHVINTTINAWLQSEKGKQNLEQNGMQAAGGTPADLKTYIADELRKWGPVIKNANIEM
jgi:tripartite-type tricarboxylate transporter receptor subunit TctC